MHRRPSQQIWVSLWLSRPLNKKVRQISWFLVLTFYLYHYPVCIGKETDYKPANASLISPFSSTVKIPPWLPYQLIRHTLLLNLFHLQLSDAARSSPPEGKDSRILIQRGLKSEITFSLDSFYSEFKLFNLLY